MDAIPNLLGKVEKSHKWIVIIFFSLYLVVGLLIFNDYGLAVDDSAQKLLGDQSFNYIFKGQPDLLISRDRDHGAAFELTITLLYTILNLKTDVQIYYFRHLAAFLAFFTGMIFFYRLLKMRFENWKLALLGTIFLILSPRIFESSFVNTKDIPFMAFSIISLYTLFVYDRSRRPGDAIIHGAVTGYMIAIRPVGILMVAITGLLWLTHLIHDPRQDKHKIGYSFSGFGLFVLFTVLFIYLWWPWLWDDPINNFTAGVISMSQYLIWQGEVLYIGKLYDPKTLPWHYTLIWILVTTPLIYSFYFLLGVFDSIKRQFQTRFSITDFNIRYDLVMLTWFFIPLIMVAVLHSVLYSGWRHMFFIYPAMLVLAINGICFLMSNVKKAFHSRLFPIFVSVPIFLSILGTLATMIMYHPYEGLYFTIFSGKNMKSANFRYGMDFYGLCSKEALDHVIEMSGTAKVKIFPSTSIVRRSAFLIPWDQRIRIEWVEDLNDAEYFIGAYHDQRSPFILPESFKKVYSVEVGKVDTCVVYKSRDDR